MEDIKHGDLIDRQELIDRLYELKPSAKYWDDGTFDIAISKAIIAIEEAEVVIPSNRVST